MIDTCSSTGLSDWLDELGMDARGTMEQKRQRIREHSEFLSAPPAEMLAEAIGDLRALDVASLESLCHGLEIPTENSTKQTKLRRLHHFIAVQEGLLPHPAHAGQFPTAQEVYRLVNWYPHYQTKDRERALYDEFFNTMTHVFGEDLVHEQMAVAHGTTLKIDFHIGSAVPGQGGVGVEFKMPATNSDVQKAMGQLGQYQKAYGQSLIVVVFPDLVQPKHLQPLFHDLASRGIAYVVKGVFDG